MEFGKFLAYYADAPEIEKPTSRPAREERKTKRNDRNSQRGDKGQTKRGKKKAEKGYKRLFINLGKNDGFYPGEVMQYINKHVKGRQDVGHIDLLDKFSYIEVPEKDAAKVMKALDGTVYKGREVRCNDADEKGHGRKVNNDNGDWRQFFKNNNVKFKDDEPDFSEEGWAMRKPRKK